MILADRGFDVADSVGLYNAELKIQAFTKSNWVNVKRVIGEAYFK